MARNLLTNSDTDILVLNTGGGMTEVIHDSSLSGQGTSDSPLGVNPELISNKLSSYVPFSAEEVSIGFDNSAVNYSLAQGYYNSANTNSFSQGTRNYAYQDSLAQGIDNSAQQYSLTQGKANSAYNYGVAIGSATTALNFSQAFGKGTIASSNGMAIGSYNKTDSAAFVIGDGESEYVKSDSFIVYHDGSVSAKGKISANGVELGAGAISSYSTAWNGMDDYFINGLNGKNISASVAGQAREVDIYFLDGQGYVKNLSSEYGTVSIKDHWHQGDKVGKWIESTNSAILTTGEEGFSSGFDTTSIRGGLNPTSATFTWDKIFPNTEFEVSIQGSIFYSYIPVQYSANTNVTGELSATNPNAPETFKLSIPNATSITFWCPPGSIDYSEQVDIMWPSVSAAGTIETVVGELAWASAIPSYEYDSSNKISAINGSALGGGVPQSAFDELKASYDALSSIVATYSGQWSLPN